MKKLYRCEVRFTIYMWADDQRGAENSAGIYVEDDSHWAEASAREVRPGDKTADGWANSVPYNAGSNASTVREIIDSMSPKT
jgi:hypothetical protein